MVSSLVQLSVRAEREAQGPLVLFSDSFEDGLNAWTIVTAEMGSRVVLTSTPVYSGAQAAALVRQSAGSAMLSHRLPLTTDVRVRGWVYDPGDETAGAFEVDRLSDGQYSLLALPPAGVYPGSYGLRFGAQWVSPVISRSMGWRAFDLLVTAEGTMARIDGKVLDRPVTSQTLAVWLNTAQTQTDQVKIIAPWSPGALVVDEVSVTRPSTEIDELLLSVKDDFLDVYGVTDFSPLYATLGMTNSVPCLPDMRSLAGTAMAFALDSRTGGGRGGAARVPYSRQRAIHLISDTLAYGQWAYDDINSGVLYYCNLLTTYELALSAWIIWWDLPEDLRTAVKARVVADAERYTGLPPHSGYALDTKAEENAWTAKFLALAANMFPAEPKSATWEARARCFAYHTITNQPTTHCGYTTQTVHGDFTLDNHNLSPNPLYADAVLQELGGGALTYRAASRPTPPEFGRNVVNLWNRNKQDIDWGRTYYYRANNDVDSQGWQWMGGSIAAFLRLEPSLTTNGVAPLSAEDEQHFLQRRWLINDGRVAIPTGPVAAITETIFSPAWPSGVWFRNANQVQDGFIWGYMYHHPEVLARTTQFSVTHHLPLISLHSLAP